MKKPVEFDLYFARLVWNDCGWRFTLCEIYHTSEEPSWCLLYLSWHRKLTGKGKTLRCTVCS